MSGVRTVVVAACAIGCGDPAARVTLAPIGGPCGRPASANQLAVTAFAESGEVKRAFGLGQAIEIGDFPADTVQLGVEVLIGGGAIGARGKTAPLAFAELDDGAVIPIAMLPPEGMCPVGELGEPRLAPQVARAGDGVLVVGGIGPEGPLSTAELYDPATGTFAPVEVPEALRDETSGLAGVVLATLPDGRVALSGGARGLLAVFDPRARSFGATFALAPQRAFHGAVATPRGLLVAGGCQGVDGGTCNASPLRSMIEYGLDGEPIVAGPSLAQGAIAQGAQLFDLGGTYLLAGGFGTFGEAHRFALDDREATTLLGLAAQPVQLDGGAVLTAFAADGSAAGDVAVVTPSGAVVPTRTGPALDGARLVALEDGSVVAFGGGGEVARYDPTTDTWERTLPAGEPPAVLARPAAIRLADGSVLVLGDGDVPSTRAWLYRPSLVGPMSGSVTVVPASPTGTGTLVIPDPRTVTRGATFVLEAADDTLAARALVGGPKLRRGSVQVTATIVSGGLALIAQQTAPDRAVVAHLVPGAPARLEQLGQGTTCTGEVVPMPAAAITATLAVADGIEVRIGDVVVLACGHVATATGSWGVAASGTGARIEVAAVTVAR
jgi:hypothetical protein